MTGEELENAVDLDNHIKRLKEKRKTIEELKLEKNESEVIEVSLHGYFNNMPIPIEHVKMLIPSLELCINKKIAEAEEEFNNL